MLINLFTFAEDNNILMKLIQKVFTLPKDKYYEKHLAIINPLLPFQMTEKEIEVIAAFLEVESELGKYTFSSIGRKQVRVKLKLSNGGLSNYLRELKLKNFILEDKDSNLSILDILKPEDSLQGYQIKLIKSKDS